MGNIFWAMWQLGYAQEQLQRILEIQSDNEFTGNVSFCCWWLVSYSKEVSTQLCSLCFIEYSKQLRGYTEEYQFLMISTWCIMCLNGFVTLKYFHNDIKILLVFSRSISQKELKMWNYDILPHIFSCFKKIYF